jgi:hypothetical protein
MLNHTMNVQAAGSALGLTPPRKGVMVPSSHPLLSVTVDGRKKKMVNQPYVSIEINIQAVLELQHLKENFPLLAKSTGDINP